MRPSPHCASSRPAARLPAPLPDPTPPSALWPRGTCHPVPQFNYGWLYLRYVYNRVPYFAAVAQLELLAAIVVQVFGAGLASVIQQAALLQVTLLLCVLINTVVWPTVNPLLVLLGFVSFSILIMTVALSVLLGDGSSALPMSDSGALALGAVIVLINGIFLAALAAVSVRYLRALVQRQFMAYHQRTWTAVRGMVEKSRSLGRSSISSIQVTAGCRVLG